MDSGISNAIHLHCRDGTTVIFTPTAKGLYRYELPVNETASDFWSMVSTVAGQARGFPISTPAGQQIMFPTSNATYARLRTGLGVPIGCCLLSAFPESC